LAVSVVRFSPSMSAARFLFPPVFRSACSSNSRSNAPTVAS